MTKSLFEFNKKCFIFLYYTKLMLINEKNYNYTVCQKVIFYYIYSIKRFRMRIKYKLYLMMYAKSDNQGIQIIKPGNAKN